MRLSKEQTEALLGEIAGILQTTSRNLPARVVGLKIGDTCGRCGGCGRYSYNMMHGDMCYGCSGRGQVMSKNLEALKASALEAVADGRLERYLEGLRAQKRCKNASERIFAAWNEVDAVTQYGRNWSKVADIKQGSFTGSEADKARLLSMAAINDRCHQAQQRFEKFQTEFQFGKGDKDWVAFETLINEVLEVMAVALRDAQAVA